MHLNGRYSDVVNIEFVFNSFLLNNTQWAYIYFTNLLLKLTIACHQWHQCPCTEMHVTAQTVLNIKICYHNNIGFWLWSKYSVSCATVPTGVQSVSMSDPRIHNRPVVTGPWYYFLIISVLIYQLWSKSEMKDERSVMGCCLLLQPMHGISCRLAWNSCIRLLLSKDIWKLLFVSPIIRGA